MNPSCDYSDKELSFTEWLAVRYNTTPQKEYAMFRATSSKYGDYNRAMDWYRVQYRKDMEKRKALSSENPFNK